MPSIEKIVTRDLTRITLVMVLLVLIIAVASLFFFDRWNAQQEAGTRFRQIDQILRENQSELRELEIEYNRTSLKNAEAAREDN